MRVNPGDALLGELDAYVEELGPVAGARRFVKGLTVHQARALAAPFALTLARRTEHTNVYRAELEDQQQQVTPPPPVLTSKRWERQQRDAEIHRLVSEGMPQKQVALMMGLSESAVSRALKRYTATPTVEGSN